MSCTLGTIIVSGDPFEMAAPCQFLPTRPDYLADLTELEESETVQGNLALTFGRQPQINGRSWTIGSIEDTFHIADVVQRSVTDNSAEHPFHLHVTPFQLLRFPKAGGLEEGVDASGRLTVR